MQRRFTACPTESRGLRHEAHAQDEEKDTLGPGVLGWIACLPSPHRRSKGKLCLQPQFATHLPLECLIGAQPEYQLGQPIVVTGTLQSRGPAIWVLSWSTFLDPKVFDSLTITTSGSTGFLRGILPSTLRLPPAGLERLWSGFCADR
jgi:hypothetical protein